MYFSDVTEILDLAKDGQYHLACAKYFEVLHNKPASKPILHPNLYFAESRAILTGDDSGKGKKKQNSSSCSINKNLLANGEWTPG